MVLVVVLAYSRQKKSIAKILPFVDLVHCNKSACRYNHSYKRRIVRRKTRAVKGRQMKSYTLEMADGSGLSEGHFNTDKDAVAWAVSVLEQQGNDAAELVAGDWETRTPDSLRKLFWADEESAEDDTGANAIAHLVKIAQNQQFAVQYNFMGRATQEHFDAAQAVADAMEIHGTTDTTKEVISKACQILGNDWDAKSVLAMIENCSFSRIDQEASEDA